MQLIILLIIGYIVYSALQQESQSKKKKRTSASSSDKDRTISKGNKKNSRSTYQKENSKTYYKTLKVNNSVNQSTIIKCQNCSQQMQIDLKKNMTTKIKVKCPSCTAKHIIKLDINKNKDWIATSTLNTKVVGVTFDNRQQVVKNLFAGQELKLKREPHNIHDENAIAVYNKHKQVGYIKKELASQLAPYLDENKKYRCKVNKVLGGGAKNYGVNIKIELRDSLNSIRKENDNSTINSTTSNDYYDEPTVDDYRDWAPGDAASWDDCSAHPDMCCGYNH
ncbi:MAG: HIRAN domain-containing protein [Bacillota bacterium]